MLLTVTRYAPFIPCGSDYCNSDVDGFHFSVTERDNCRDQDVATGELTYQQERAAELSVERWFEERGGAEDDPIERAAWAREDDDRAERELVGAW